MAGEAGQHRLDVGQGRRVGRQQDVRQQAGAPSNAGYAALKRSTAAFSAAGSRRRMSALRIRCARWKAAKAPTAPWLAQKSLPAAAPACATRSHGLSAVGCMKNSAASAAK